MLMFKMPQYIIVTLAADTCLTRTFRCSRLQQNVLPTEKKDKICSFQIISKIFRHSISDILHNVFTKNCSKDQYQFTIDVKITLQSIIFCNFFCFIEKSIERFRLVFNQLQKCCNKWCSYNKVSLTNAWFPVLVTGIPFF